MHFVWVNLLSNRRTFLHTIMCYCECIVYTIYCVYLHKIFCSVCTLMIMCIERYLGVYHSIYHKTSVTKRRLLTLLAILTMTTTTLKILPTNDLVMSVAVALSIFMAIFIPPFIFFNYKLFKISRNIRRQKATSPENRKKLCMKNINTCLLAVACLVFFFSSNRCLRFIWFNRRINDRKCKVIISMGCHNICNELLT